jgi:hypothetical protein
MAVPRTRCNTQYCFAEPGPYRTAAFDTVPALRSSVRTLHRVRDTTQKRLSRYPAARAVIGCDSIGTSGSAIRAGLAKW